MGRKVEQTRVAHREDALGLEQTSIYDDSLLPPAEELAKLKSIDPDSINWIKRRTEIEQDARIKFNNDKIKLMDKNMTHVLVQNMTCIIVTFLIIAFGMICSAFFVYKGLKVEGTIFGGSSIFLAGVIFLRWTRGSKDKPKD